MASAYVFTHRSAAVVENDAELLVGFAQRHGVELRADEAEAEKHPALREAVERACSLGFPEALATADAAIVLGGDGTLLSILNKLQGGPPVVGVNYGLLGYLSAVDRGDLESALEAVAAGRLQCSDLCRLETEAAGQTVTALNDVVVSAGVTGRIVDLAWRIVRPGEAVDEMGIVSCDGMVVATPVGSTAYNLSNGGPIVAWGVSGYVVSFIAPHTLQARPMVVAPDDVIELEHMGRGVALQIMVDGQSKGELSPGARLRVSLSASTARLALIDGPSFYARYSERFTMPSARFRHDQEVR